MMQIVGSPLQPKFNVYDIRESCQSPPLCYNFTLVDAFLRRPEVQKKLLVEGKSWTECSKMVHLFLMGDWMVSLVDDITYLLDDQKVFVFVYSGDKDFICNWRGGEAWTNDLSWTKQGEFQQAQYLPWGENYGSYKMVDNFAFVRVFDSGHMVPMNQPEAALYMFGNFLKKWKDI